MSIFNTYKPLKVILLVITVLLFSYLAYRYYEKPINTRNVKTEARFTAEQFLTLVAINNAEELKKYIEKGIEISGVIKKITHEKGIYTLILGGDQNKIFIICEMQQDEIAKVRKLKIGELVEIKGVYKGVLNDVILLNCLVV